MGQKNENKFSVKFWGVRGTYPVSGKKTVRFGGNTPCVEVRAGKNLIVLDAGTVIIGLGEELINESQKNKKPVTAAILLSHLHRDHIQGFSFFKPAYIGNSQLYIFGPKLYYADLKEILSKTMTSPHFPIEFDEMKANNIFSNFARIVFPGFYPAFQLP